MKHIKFFLGLVISFLILICQTGYCGENTVVADGSSQIGVIVCAHEAGPNFYPGSDMDFANETSSIISPDALMANAEVQAFIADMESQGYVLDLDSVTAGHCDNDKDKLYLNFKKAPTQPTERIGTTQVENLQHHYSSTSVHETALCRHLRPAISPDKTNREGKSQFYYLGDYVTANGNDCECVYSTLHTCVQHTYDVRVSCKHWDTYTWTDKDGKEHTESYQIHDYDLDHRTSGGCGNTYKSGMSTNHTHPWKAVAKGFEWGADGEILNVDKAYYDEGSGNYYGIIEFSTGCCCKNCVKPRIIYFGDPKPPKTINLTVKINPEQAGKVTIKGPNLDKTIYSTQTIEVIAENSYSIEVEENSGYKYKWIRTDDSVWVERESSFTYQMPSTDITLIADFAKVQAHNLYVTSNEGGKIVEATNLANNLDGTVSSDTYKKYTNVYTDTEINLEYECIDENLYEFVRWEYRPFVEEEIKDDCYSLVYMPDCDLTATAIFKKKHPLIEQNPTLTVISNNKEWGNVQIDSGVIADKVELETVADQQYSVNYYPVQGYYFTNWEYNSTSSPFIDAQNRIIKMPNYDLEITGLFSPIPTQSNNGHSVTFVAETLTPEDGIIPGTVPQNLENIAGGAEVTFGVTPNSGYKFLRWYFTDKTGNGAIPLVLSNSYQEHGSGMFIMPDTSNVVAHAVFVKEEPKNKIIIKIEGQGDVIFEESIIPGPTGGNLLGEFIPGTNIKLEAKPGENGGFSHFIDEYGNRLSDETILNYIVKGDITITAVFNNKKYRLYVSSTIGGDAFPNNLEGWTSEYIEETNKYIYYIDTYAGKEFYISYGNILGNYSFDKWEYKPGLQPKAEENRGLNGYTQIIMPASDLTVTAVFKNDSETDKPYLRVIPNNKYWGEVSGEAIGSSKNKLKQNISYKVDVGTKWELKPNAFTNFYFINWEYSTNETPFISANKIEMPNKNLDVMAFFAPIPEVDEENGHKITFVAEPEEGGRIPQQIDQKIKAGSKVTIGATPNVGWEFDYWYFKNANNEIVSVEFYHDADGSGYFIMPDEDVIAVAVFKRVGYTLYVTYTIGGSAYAEEIGITKIENAIPGKKYKIVATENAGYEFGKWEVASGEYQVIGDSTVTETYIVMPNRDVTATAVFNQITLPEIPTLRVISNNYEWGNAELVDEEGNRYSWKGDGHLSNHEPGIPFDYTKNYTIRFEAYDGYVYKKWEPVQLITTINNEGNKIGSGKMEFLDNTYFEQNYKGKDVEIVVYFDIASPDYKLSVEVSPNNAGKIYQSSTKLKVGEKFTVEVEEVSKNYEFQYWYEKRDGGKIIRSYKEKYSAFMPDRDLTLVAYFEKVIDEGDPIPEVKDENTLSLIILGDGQGSVYDGSKTYKQKDYVYTIKMELNDVINLQATPSSGSYLAEWRVNGVYKSNMLSYTYGNYSGEDVKIEVVFIKEEENNYTYDGFKIISVRDLRWQDYFVAGSTLTGNKVSVPMDDTTMLKDIKVNGKVKYPKDIKLGYAVEFELATSQITPENAYIIITPTLWKGSHKIDWDDISSSTDLDKYKEIKIYCDDDSTSKDTQKSFQTSVRLGDTPEEQKINKLIWNWIYYLPADIRIDDDLVDSDDIITVKLDINLYSKVPTQGTTNKYLRENIAKYEKKYTGTTWTGKVFNYTLDKTVFDDIYDNAQN